MTSAPTRDRLPGPSAARSAHPPTALPEQGRGPSPRPPGRGGRNVPSGGPSGDRLGTFASLRIHNFRLFVSSQIVSNSGAWTQRVAQDWLVLTLTGSPAAVGVTTALQFAPSIVFSMAGGLAADRFDKRRLLLVTQTTLGVCSAILAALCLADIVQFWHVLTVAFATGVAAAFDNPTRQAFVHEMVGPRHVSNAVSINSAVFQLGALIGPAISAVLIASIGIGFSFAVNALSFVAVVIALMTMNRAQLFRVTAPGRQRGQIRRALSEIRRRPELRWPIALAGVCGFVTANFPVVLVAFVKEMSFSAGGYGLLTCSLAAGSLIGALLAARRPHTRLRHLTALALAIAVTLFIAAAMPGTVTLCAALVLAGAASMPFGITANTSVQLASGDTMRGRVMGVYMLAVLGAAGVGGPALGLLVESIGARGGLVASGLLISVVTCFAMFRLYRSGGVGPVRIVRAAWDQRHGDGGGMPRGTPRRLRATWTRRHGRRRPARLGASAQRSSIGRRNSLRERLRHE